ncbi:MAG: type II toxin-antitoxin system HicB family antitoxin [Acidobacteria bacterium]|nr:type II toxin-antitoxin system HicB family antitoxin [Acidobacteriota bacterium]
MRTRRRASGEPCKRYQFTVVFEPAEEGGYVAHVPALRGLWTQGETLAQTRRMVREAISGYLEGLIKSGEPVPEDRPRAQQVEEVMEVAVPA